MSIESLWIVQKYLAVPVYVENEFQTTDLTFLWYCSGFEILMFSFVTSESDIVTIYSTVCNCIFTSQLLSEVQ